MATTMHFTICMLFSSLSLLFFAPFSHATFSDSQNYVCNNTPFPDFCKYMLPQNNKSATIHDYGQFFVRQSLKLSKNLLKVVNDFLKYPQSLSQAENHALEDCQFLLGSNIDYLSDAIQTMNSSLVLGLRPADNAVTLFSAIMTNVETCLDGLQAAASSPILQNVLLKPLLIGKKMHSVSLALFKNGWVSNKKQGRGLTRRWFPFSGTGYNRNGGLPVKMSSQHQKIYESRGRKLLQTNGGGAVQVSDVVVVNRDGSGNFTTINAAVAAAPDNANSTNGYYLIYVVAGIYREYVNIPSTKTYLMMVGDGIKKTIITGNHSVVDGWTTFNSSTFAVNAQGFVAVNITFRNTAGAVKQQAVAVRSDSDLSAFYSCSFEGYQDTLYARTLRQFYKECDIYGTVDFIFGNAAVVFQNCNIYARQPLQGQFNTVTAQGRTDINQNTGTSMQNCTIKAAKDLASSNFTVQTYLGRPWKQYSRTVYMQSRIDSLINSTGWAPWSGDFALSTLYYAEYANKGPGSSTANRVNWPGYHVINANVAVNFTVSNFIYGDDWLPMTQVPYTSGLM